MSHFQLELTDGWTLKQQDEAEAEWLPVKSVPTQVHIDLLNNKKIPDPYLDLNERAVQWVGEKTWVYRVTFAGPSSSPNDASRTSTDLVFDGLDTFASVNLNGVEILQSDNMFMSYRVDITSHIKSGEDNLLEITFDSAWLRGRQLVKEHSHEHKFLVRQTDAGRLPIRKAQYNWGWDWGPILMTAGPWKPVVLERYVARVDDVWVQYQLSDDLKKCSGVIFAHTAGALQDGDMVQLSLSIDGKVEFQQEVAVNKEHLTQVAFDLEQPKLWYPLGYGEQSRYQLQAKIVSGNEARELSTMSKVTGFRKTELVQTPDAYGKSFYLRINNIDVFCGGSCWIPTDSFQAQISAQRFRDWVVLMAQSNQVMLRIWGGGVYEHDALLDAADELGVMILHDFQFACGSYPTYDSYLSNFEAEARQQIRRLRTHPAVVVWAGNNEDYQVQERYKLDYDFENKLPDEWRRSSFPARYIYEYLLPKLVKEEDPHMIYHPSSPWGDGKPTADPTVGDIHQWNIWHGTMEKYQIANRLGGRFVSEFGMEAYPHMSTLDGMITDPSQRHPGSMSMDSHNKAIGQERRLLSYIVENFRLDRTSLELGPFAHLTQVIQAETMRYAYKSWRRDWGVYGDADSGDKKDAPPVRKCGGVLVWQLNDCWPTISWAIVDYHLVPKPAFYAISRAMRPLDVGVSRVFSDWTQTEEFIDEVSGLKTGQVDHPRRVQDGNVFDVWIASSKTAPVSAQISVRFISVRTGNDVREPIVSSVQAMSNTTTTIHQLYQGPSPYTGSSDPKAAFDIAEYDPYIIHATLSAEGGVVASDSAWPEPYKYLDLHADRGLKFSTPGTTGNQLVVTSERPVKGLVFEEMPGLKLSDNGIDVIPGEEHIIKVQGSLKASELRYTYIGAPGASLSI